MIYENLFFSFFVTRNKTSMHNFLIQPNLYVLSWVVFYTYDELNRIENFSTRKKFEKIIQFNPTRPIHTPLA